MPEETKQLILQRLDIRNVLKIKVFSLDMTESEIVELNGNNSNGKTTVLDCLTMLLAGKQAVPSDPVNEDADSGEITGWIKSEDGVFKIRRNITRKGTTITVRDGNGPPISSPQDFLDKIATRFAVDPKKAYGMKDRELKELLLKHVTIDLDIEATDSEIDIAFKKRTDVNRDVKRAEGHLGALPRPEADTPDKEQDINKLIEAKDLAVKNQQDHNELIRSLDNLKGRASDIDLAEYDRKIGNVKEWKKNEIARINQEAKDKIDQANEAKERDTQTLEELNVEIKEFNQKVESGAPDPGAIEKHNEALKRVDESNKAIRAKVEYNKAREQLQNYEDASERLTNIIKDLEDKKTAAFRNAEWPMENVGVNDLGNVTFNGKPLSQAGGAERWDFAIDFAIAAQEKLAEETKLNLKLIFVDEIGDLDDKHIESLRTTLKKNGYQGIVTAVRKTGAGDCTIEMVDGKIKE